METTWERRQAGSAYEELIGFACAQTFLETHTVPALEDCSTSVGIQGVCDTCVNGELEQIGTRDPEFKEEQCLDLQVLVSVHSVLFK